MTTERLLRWTAVLVAIAAAIDPPISLDGRTRPRISLVVQDSPSMDLPVADGQSGRLAAAQVTARLKADLQRDFNIVGARDEAAAWTIVVGDRYPLEPFPDDGGVSTVTLSRGLTPNVRIAGVDAPSSVPAATAVRLRIHLEANGVRGSGSEVIVRTHGAVVGRASHEWNRDREIWTTEIGAVPVGAPPYRFDIDVTSRMAERTDLDNHAAVDVDRAPRLRVFVLEARPSWASAFVRRALEDDPRFDVSGLTQAAPRLPLTFGDQPAAPPDRLDRFDEADAIIVGGIEALSSNQVATLEHFIVDRGGSVALVPDTGVTMSTTRRLLPDVETSERLLDRSAALTMKPSSQQLEASELLETGSVPRGGIVLARNPGSDHPIVWVSPVGEGNVLFSGAMDAWRFRGEHDGGFARFWRSTIAGLALAARPAIDIQLSPARAVPGERIRVTARVRRLERRRFGDRLAIDGRTGRQSVRLWPDAAQGSFRGSFVADASATSTIVTASIGDGSVRGVARLTVDPGARRDNGVPLALLATSHRGVNVDTGHVAELERHLRSSVSTKTERRTHYPMRSSWWFAPFAACLCVEWWLRRRSGRR